MNKLCECGCGIELVPYDRAREGRKKGDWPRFATRFCGISSPFCKLGHTKINGRCKKCSAARIRSKKYGITIEEALNIPKRCQSCKRKMRIPHADHNHVTGEFRAWLCHGCNLGIGFFEEDINLMLSAIEYLRSFDE